MGPHIVWLIIAGIMFIGEIATTGFLIFWIGIGALIAMGLSFFVDSILVQTVIFVLSSISLILLTKPLMDKFKPKETPSNVYTILGKKALVSRTIDNAKSDGQIKIDGDIWAAKSDNDETINEGVKVEVLRIDGVKAIVKELK